MNKTLKTAKELVNIAIKNSQIIQPYVKPKHYVRGLLALNGLYLLLKLADKDTDNHGDNHALNGYATQSHAINPYATGNHAINGYAGNYGINPHGIDNHATPTQSLQGNQTHQFKE